MNKIREFALATTFLCVVTSGAMAQSSPGLFNGQIPTASDWNGYFASKQDVNTLLSEISAGTVNSTPGTFGSSTQCVTIATNSAGLITSISQAACAGGGGGTPGGSNTQLQYNNSGAFGGISTAVFSGGVLTLTGPVFITPALGTPASGNAANITNLQSANLVGALPAISGASLTSLTAANLSGAVPINKGGTNCTVGAVACLTSVGALSGSASNSTFLRGDGAWATPAGSGNVTGPGSAVSGDVVSFNGTSGTLVQDSGILTSALATLTGTQTLTNKSMSGASNTFTAIPLSAFTNLGTTTTVLHGNAVGNPTFGAVNLANDVTGNLSVANLNGGTSASNSTFWRGDGTWATVSGSGNAIFGTTSGNTSGDLVCMSNTTVGIADCGITYGLTGNSKLVETTSGGLLTASLLPAATNSTIGGIIAGTGLSMSTSTLNVSVTNNAQTGTTYATLATDGAKLVSLSNASPVAVSLSVASTSGFTVGFGTEYYNIGAGLTTVTATTSNFDNAKHTLAIAQGQDAYVWSDSTNYHAALSLPVMAADTLLGNFSGAPEYPIAGALTSCSGGSNALTYNTSTHAFGCNTISGSGTVNNGTAQQVAYYASSTNAVSGSANFTITTGALTLGASGTLGSVQMGNATSGTVTLAPVAGALGSVTASLPANTGVIAELNVAQTWTAQQSNTITALTASSNTYTPTGASNNYSFTLAATNTVANPSATPVAGTSGVFVITQDGTGSRTITWGSQYQGAGGSSTVQPGTTASSVSIIPYFVIDSTHIAIGAGLSSISH